SASQAGSRPRGFALWTLSLALIAAVLMHYYGIFLPLPFVVADLARSLRRRSLDVSLALALTLPFLAFALNIPFMHVLGEVRAHYYDSGETAWGMAAYSYVWLLGAHYGAYLFAHGKTIQFLLDLLFAGGAL